MMFSIAIPAYKPQFLEEAIKSIVFQTYSDWELLILDDASPHDLYSIVMPYLSDTRVHYFRNAKNVGAVNVVDNWNRCVELCSGDFLICMGDDDRLLPDCLTNLERMAGRHPGLGLYHSRTQIINAEGAVSQTLESRPEVESSLEMIFARWQGRNQYIGDFCFDLALLRKNGGFTFFPLAWGADDVSAYIAAKGDGVRIPDEIANVNEPGFQYRESDLTISSGNNYRLKLAALIACKNWYIDDFRDRKKKGDTFPVGFDNVFIEKFKSFSEYYVRKDASGSIGSMFYWMKRRKQTGLSIAETVIFSLKGIITRR